MTKPDALTYFPHNKSNRVELTCFDICDDINAWNAHYGIAYIDYRLTFNNKLFSIFKLGLE